MAPSTTNPTCWMLEVPMVIGTGTDIIGMPGLGIGFGTDTSGGSCLMTGDNFPGPIPPPAQSTLTLNTNNGTPTVASTIAEASGTTATFTIGSGSLPAVIVPGSLVTLSSCSVANYNTQGPWTVNTAGFSTTVFKFTTPSNYGSATGCIATVTGLSSGTTISVLTTYTNDRCGGTCGVSGNHPNPGYSYHSTEQQLAIAGCTGGGCSVSVSSPAAQCASNNTQCGAFSATGYTVAVSSWTTGATFTTIGQEIDGCTGAANLSQCNNNAIACAGGNTDASDPNGACAIGNQATIISVPTLPGQGTGAHAPPPVDRTSVPIIVGDTNSSTIANSNSFSQRLANFVLIAGGCSGCSPGNQEYAPSQPITPGNHTPSCGIEIDTAQESTTIDMIQMWGPFSGCYIYGITGQWAGVRGFQPLATHAMDSNPAYTTGSFYNVVIDGTCCFGQGKGIYNIDNSSFNYHPANGTYNKAGANIYIRGNGINNQVMANITNYHGEGWPAAGYDNITVDWGAVATVSGSSAFANGGTTNGGVHRCGSFVTGSCLSGVPGAGIDVVGETQGGFPTTCSILDEPRSLCLKPPSASPFAQLRYDSTNYLAKWVTTAASTQIFNTSAVFQPIGTPTGSPFAQMNGHTSVNNVTTTATFTLSQGLWPQAYQPADNTIVQVASCGAYNTGGISINGSASKFYVVATGGEGTSAFTATTSASGAQASCTTYVPASFGVEANANYTGSCDGFYKGTATTTTPEFQWVGPASPTSFEWSLDATLTSGSATKYSATSTAYSSPLVPGAIVTTATDMPFHISFGLQNGANPGVLQLQFAAGGVGTLTIEPNMVCTLQPQQDTL
jgi:hypothetical protein